MKILAVNMSLDPLDGGTVERTLQLSRALLKTGADVRLLTTSKGLPPRLKEDFGDRLTALPVLSERFYVPSRGYGKIAQMIAEADLVHVMNHWTLLTALVSREARRQSKPYVFCPAGSLPLFGRSLYLKKLYNAVAGRTLVRGAAGVIAVTELEIDSIRRYGVESSKIRIFPNGIEPSDFLDNDAKGFRGTFGLPDQPFFLFLGRLNPIKGPDLLLQAYVECAARIPGWHLVFAGPDGGMLEQLRELAGRSGLSDRVHFIGPIAGKLKSQALHAAQVVVIPSRQEAQSIVVLEAGICGRPVILTDQCGFDLAAQSGGGWVVSPTVQSIGAGLLEAVRKQDSLDEMGAKLKELCSKSYSWAALARQYLEYFSKILAADIGSQHSL